jgi:Tfp pilus tip-associated adhesin PilY1
MKITKIFRPGSLAIGAAVVTAIAVAGSYFSPEEQPLGYMGPLELTTTDLTHGAKAYRTWFENGAWQGDLVEHDVTATGGISTSVDLSEISPSNPLGTQWSANVQFGAAITAKPDYWTSTRKIITTNSIGQTAFRWANLTDAQKAAIDPDAKAIVPVVTSSDLLDFVRGDRSNEKTTAPGTLRPRVGILGDMIHSNPEHVAKPKEVFTDTSYVAFANAHDTRAGRVYVGANDGMLHVFDADTGNEVYAYIPSMLIPKLNKLAAFPYNHTYFVDGEISVRDVEYDGAWHSVLVG